MADVPSRLDFNQMCKTVVLANVITAKVSGADAPAVVLAVALVSLPVGSLLFGLVVVVEVKMPVVVVLLVELVVGSIADPLDFTANQMPMAMQPMRIAKPKSANTSRNERRFRRGGRWSDMFVGSEDGAEDSIRAI